MEIFNEHSNKQLFAKGIQGEPGIGFILTSDGNYDMSNKKLTNVAEGTKNSHAITKHQLETALNDKHDSNKDIDLELKYNIKQSKPQTYSVLSANSNNVPSYEDIKEIFVSRKESSPMETHSDMGNSGKGGNFIYNVKTPTSGNHAANKQYVDGFPYQNIDLGQQYYIQKKKER